MYAYITNTAFRAIRRWNPFRGEDHGRQDQEQRSSRRKSEKQSSSWPLTGGASVTESIWDFAKGYMYDSKIFPICVILLALLLVNSIKLRKSNASFEEMLSIMPSSTPGQNHSDDDGEKDQDQSGEASHRPPLSPTTTGGSTAAACVDIKLAEALFNRQVQILGLRPVEEPSHRSLFIALYSNHVNRCIVLNRLNQRRTQDQDKGTQISMKHHLG